MEPKEAIAGIEMAMEQAVEHMGKEFSSVRTGKASPSLVENVAVEVKAYGTRMKLRDLAIISTPEPRQIVIQPHDPSTTDDIDRGIREAQLGFNPVNEGKLLRLPIPELNEERRQEMVKRVKTIAEDTKVRIRASRKEGMDNGKKMKTANALTEDSLRDYEAEVQEITDKFIKQIDQEAASKEQEVMTV